MHYLSLDYLIVYTFLLITLVIGLRAGRGVKDIREYATASKMFGTGALVLTWLATDVAGETVLDMASSVRTVGIIQPLAVFGGCGIALLLQAIFFAPKFTKFPDCLTMGDVMGKLYGANSKIITGILGLLTTICVAGMELIALGLLCESLLGLDYRWGVGVGGLILAMYSAHGGIKSVTVTDVFQFLVLLVVLPIIAVWALDYAGGIQAIFDQVPTTKLQVINHPKASYYLGMLILLDILQVGMVDPANIQRMLMAQNHNQLRNQFLVLSILSPAVQVTSMLLALTGIVLYPTLEGAQVVPQIIKDLLPIGTKGLAMAGLFAVSMGNIDSYLHAAGLTLVHDIVKPLCDKGGLVINELKWAKQATVFVSLFAIVIGLIKTEDFYNLLFVSYEFTPILVFPFWSGVLGLKADSYAFYIAAGVTIVVLFLSKFLLPTAQGHLVVFISLAANGIVFYGIHAIRNKGLIIVSHTQEKKYFWKPHRKNILTRLKHLLPTPQRIVRNSQNQVEYYDAPYLFLGVFCVVNYIIPYFMWTYKSTHSELILYLRLLGAICCALMIVKDKWPSYLLPYLPTFWHLTLLYCLPFTGTVMFLITQGSVEWLINIAIMIMFLIVLVDWLSFIILTLLGIALGLLFHHLALGPISLQLDFSTGYLLVYQGIFATLIGLLFARRKQQRFDRINTHNKALIANNQESQDNLLETFRDKIRIIQSLQHAGVQDLLQVAKLVKEVRIKARQEALPLSETAARLEATLIPMALQLRNIEARATNFMRLSIEELPIQDLLHHLQEHLATKGSHTPLKYYVTTHVKALTGDPKRLQTLLVSSITALRTGEESSHLLLGIEDTRLCYDLPSVNPGYQKRVAALRFTITSLKQLPKLEPSYTASMNGTVLSSPETAQELVLLENKRIVGAHYGYMHATPGTFTYVLPVQLEDVRPEDVDSPHMELGAVPVRADDQYPGAQAQEEAFLQALQARSTADLELVKSVIELIKWYHGPVKRQTGEPFYLHPLAVAKIVLDYNQEEATILAALLHDTVEDTAMLLSDIQAVFGKDTADLVDTVTHLESGQDGCYKIKLSAVENIMMLVQSGDDRAMYVKLADRLHNMRTIAGKSTESQIRIAKETFQFFVPQAYKLRLDATVEELTTRSWQVLEEHKVST